MDLQSEKFPPRFFDYHLLFIQELRNTFFIPRASYPSARCAYVCRHARTYSHTHTHTHARHSLATIQYFTYIRHLVEKLPTKIC
jgi:hypothetical protein